MDGVAMDPTKVEAIQQWPQPQALKVLRGFLGLTGYYRRLINNYGAIAAPLMVLLKDAFRWSPVASDAIMALKAAPTSSPALQ
jgi:hypothetical protein